MTASSGTAGGVPRVLHVHGSLAAGDPQAERCVRLINAFGGRLRHTLVAGDGDFGALDSVARGIPVERRLSFPTLAGLPLPGKLQRLAREIVDYHLVLTYGRRGIMTALAHTSFGEVYALPPLVHHEDGSDESAEERRKLGSKWPRRLGLGKATGLVIPTETMEAVALVEWQQPLGRVKLIADGIDLDRYAPRKAGKGIGRLLKRPGECWIGCFTHGDGTGLSALVETLPRVEERWHLVVVGKGQGRESVAAAASRLTLDHRVHLVELVPDRAEALALFDILAVPPGDEPLPLSAIEAMAAGKPVIGLSPAEAAASLSPDNAQIGADGVVRLAFDDYLRGRIGAANREVALGKRGEAAMVAAYRRLYASAMKRETF